MLSGTSDPLSLLAQGYESTDSSSSSSLQEGEDLRNLNHGLSHNSGKSGRVQQEVSDLQPPRDSRKRDNSNSSCVSLVLPSAASLLSESGPPVRATIHLNQRESVIEIADRGTRSLSLQELNKRNRYTAPIIEQVIKSSAVKRADNTSNEANRLVVSASLTSAMPVTLPKVGQKRKADGAEGKVSGRDRVSAKDKVKNQRVRGQAGIGSDFRTWKSETEMVLRQQFD